MHRITSALSELDIYNCSAINVILITPPARRAWRSYKFASLSFSVFLFFFFGVQSWATAHGWYRCAYYCLSPCHHGYLTRFLAKLCHQNTHFNMYTTTSKQQEGSACKDSYQNCFIATNSTAKLWRGVMNRGEIFESVLRYFRCVSTFHLNLYISNQTHVLLLLKYLNKTPILTCK